MTAPGPVTDLTFDVLDVFTDRPFAGNQLAVVHGAAALSTAQCQALAQEFGFSETTFPEPWDDGSYAVRIFTPSTEIPFAGHPTLGTAWVLRRDGLLVGDTAVQHCAAGEIGLRFEGETVELSATPRDLAGPLPDDLVADLVADVGLGADDVTGPVWLAGCGLTFLYLPVTDDAVGRARGASRPLSEYADRLGAVGTTGDPVEGISVHHVAEDPAAAEELTVRARVFVPGVGVPEDPATGSAAAGLGMALAARGLLQGGGRYRITQGVEMGRPSVLHGRIDREDPGPGSRVARCHVAGSVRPVARGTIAVPPG